MTFAKLLEFHTWVFHSFCTAPCCEKEQSSLNAGQFRVESIESEIIKHFKKM